ncbi:hypothetical protein NDU88_004208 [Pleurodeles waltl]|uniref:Uncharacterized protein n=1 Tax=Pleurodeles waltl TaxID=8319 RepID=A0AAV7PEG3_PLEWA|nr:hypothetical protein NDU88_004208 [Pleurodeles waltl]
MTLVPKLLDTLYTNKGYVGLVQGVSTPWYSLQASPASYSAQQDKEPSQKQAAPAEVPEQALRSGVKRCSPEVAQESPTPPDDNSGGRAMQVRVPGTQAWPCTKEILGECTGAGVAAKHVVPSNAVWRGEARTYLHQTWTEESLDCESHLDRVAEFKGPRSSC